MNKIIKSLFSPFLEHLEINDKKKLNIAFCVNDVYADKVAVVMASLLENNPYSFFNIYIFSSDLTEKNLIRLNKLHLKYSNFSIKKISVATEKFNSLKLKIDYISIETYYRYLIADLLPDVDKILYLDADVIIRREITSFYDINLEGLYLAGVEDLFIKEINYRQKLGFSENELYINAGVLLMNLEYMRADKIGERLLLETQRLGNKIEYQDQDVLNLVCRGKIKQVDSIYNFTIQNIKKEKRKLKYACIIHYTGKKKPWTSKKVRQRNIWNYYNRKILKCLNKKIKVGLIINEFFGGAGTAFGGYGFLARKYIAKYIPDADIQIDVLLGRGRQRCFFAKKWSVDGVNLYKLPKFHQLSRWWLKYQNYDIYLSIELTTDWILRHETNPNKKLILWIQDPRPKSAWENVINTMQSIKDPCFYNQKICNIVHKWALNKRIYFVTQGVSLNKLAIELYDLPTETPIQLLPNPIEMDLNYQFDIRKKKKQIILLGRLEAQKRAWLFCELAKCMPEYEFLVLGKFFRYSKDNHLMLDPYMKGDIPNLQFMGHVEGDLKKQLISESRLLLSTAIWEGIPISWLEALSYGTLIVSDLERDGLVERFGKFVGTILGDGFDGVNKFIPAIKELMENDIMYQEKAKKAIQYIRQTHNISCFQRNLKEIIWQEVKK